MIKQETIEQIRAATDIVELVGGYVPLKKVGASYRGLCPFHSERSPSFYVNPARQAYHCFGCGTGGTAISFVMAMEKLEFPEAVKFLARRQGITVETESLGRNQPVYDACEQVARFYEHQLSRSEQARAYLERRGLGAETVRRFRLGFAPGGSLLRGQATRRGLSEQVLVQAGLLAERDGGLRDYFYDRLMFPIFSLSGKVIGFGGRVLDDAEPKYLNSPDTSIFRKGEALYGLFQAKGYIRDQVPVLVEGNFDLLTLADRGIPNVVAPLGTALTAGQAQVLRRYNARAIIVFDGDAAGLRASRRAIETLLTAGIDPGIVVLPDGSDPDSYVREQGPGGLAQLLAGSGDFVDFVASSAACETVAAQRAVLREIAGLLKLIPDETARELYANRAAGRFGVSGAVLLRGIEARRAARRQPADQQIEERLVGVAAQDAALACIARDFGLADTIADVELAKIARLTQQHCDDAGFGPGLLMDLLEDESLRKRIAQWTFTEAALPAAEDYRDRVKRLRARWLQREIVEAHRHGDDARAEELLCERNNLLQQAARRVR